ncbi:MAG: tRNA-dihydrouridine synthase family protein [Candidatus Micrarchaeota archaeon]
MVWGSFLSPIDNFSDLPFRLLCQRYGAEAVCYPLANSTAIFRDPRKAKELDLSPAERNAGVQLVGNAPEDLGKAAAAIDREFPFVSWYNLNCGCPSVRTMHCGGGSAMLASPVKIAECVRGMKESVDKPLSVKIRIASDLQNTLSLCRLIEEAGADFIIIHGRTAAQGYSGKADWELIKKLRQGLGIPVVGNGDIDSLVQAKRYVESGFCDSFMVARAAMGNPLIFSGTSPKSLEERLALLGEYVSLHREHLGEPELKDVRLKAVSFLSSVPQASALRNMACRAGSADEILGLRTRETE